LPSAKIKEIFDTFTYLFIKYKQLALKVEWIDLNIFVKNFWSRYDWHLWGIVVVYAKLAKVANSVAAIQTIYQPRNFTKWYLETDASYESEPNGELTSILRATWSAITLVPARTFEKWPRFDVGFEVKKFTSRNLVLCRPMKLIPGLGRWDLGGFLFIRLLFKIYIFFAQRRKHLGVQFAAKIDSNKNWFAMFHLNSSTLVLNQLLKNTF